jgi:hypothetical protein
MPCWTTLTIFALIFVVTSVPVAAEEELLPLVSVPECASGPSLLTDFWLSDGSASLPEMTEVALCWSSAGLHISYFAYNDTFMKNTYQHCNDHLYNQEVMEVFIALGSEVPTRYIEVELSPSNVLFAAHIRNPYTNGTHMTHQLINCTNSGIQWNAHKSVPDSEWEGQLVLPWDLLGGVPTVESIFRANFFRLTMLDDVDVCDAQHCHYGAWSPTFRWPPAFHVSSAFGHLRILQ